MNRAYMKINIYIYLFITYVDTDKHLYSNKILFSLSISRHIFLCLANPGTIKFFWNNFFVGYMYPDAILLNHKVVQILIF